jgi:hypothetical protein
MRFLRPLRKKISQTILPIRITIIAIAAIMYAVGITQNERSISILWFFEP